MVQREMAKVISRFIFMLILCAEREGIFMPRNQFQRMIFALLTVIVTVHAYVFYSLYVVNGNTFLALNPGASGITDLYGLGIDFKKIATRLLAVYCGFRDICPCIKQGHSFYP